jgi:tetratricopeptide (TPR) repeat protein
MFAHVTSRVLEHIYATLNSLSAQRSSSRFLRYVARAELLESIEEQSRNLETYIQYFNVRSPRMRQVSLNNFITDKIKYRYTIGINCEPRSSERTLPQLILFSPVLQNLIAPTPSRYKFKRSVPSPPNLYGRDNEVSAMVDLFTNLAPQQIHLAILGPGGMGKTSLSLSILSHARVVSTFGGSRYFLACDTTSSLDLFIHELATILDIGVDGLSSQLLQTILTRLRKQRCLLVLDNLETLWDPLHTRSEVEGFLSELSSIPTVNLLVTIRGSQHPTGVEWSQLLPPLKPLSLQAAKALFYRISRKPENIYATDLINAVDCVPLAVTLIAHLAAVHDITVESLWERWIEEKTMMVERGSDRLANLDTSISLSLNSPRMNHDPNALSFLSILALLPNGMSHHLFRSCDTHLIEIINIKRAVTTLRQNALIYEDSDKVLRILNPIRQYVLSHHPPSDIASEFIQEYFIQLALLGGDHPLFVHEQLRQEIGNIEAILVKALKSKQSVVGSVTAILSMAEYTYISGVGSCTPLEHAVERLDTLIHFKPKLVQVERKGLRRFRLGRSTKDVGREGSFDAQNELITLRADCLGCWGQLLSRQGHYQPAKDRFELALELHVKQGDIAGQAADLHNLGCLSTLDDALQKFTAALHLHEKIGDRAGVAYDMIGQGQTYLQRRQLLQAQGVFTTALQIFDGLQGDDQDPLGRITAINNLGHTLTAWNKFTDAEASFNQAIQANDAIRDIVSQADSLCGLASTLLLRSRWSEAEEKIREAMALREPFKDPDLYHVLGRIKCAQWKLTEAAETLQYARTLPRDPKDDFGRGDDLKYLAFVYALLGRVNEAEAMLDDVKVLYNSAENAVGLAEVDITKAEIWSVQGKLDEAEVVAKRAVDIMSRKDCKIGHAYALYVLGGVKLGKGLFNEARECVQQALELHTEIGCVQGPADDVALLAEICIMEVSGNETWSSGPVDGAAGALDDAEKNVNEAKALHTAIGDTAGVGDDWYLCALLCIRRGDLVQAEGALKTALEMHCAAEVVYKQAKDNLLLGRVLTGRGRAEEAVQAFDLTIGLFERLGARKDVLVSQQLRAEMIR